MHQSSSNEGVAPWSHHTEGTGGRASWPLPGGPTCQSSLNEGWILEVITGKLYKGEWGRGQARGGPSLAGLGHTPLVPGHPPGAGRAPLPMPGGGNTPEFLERGCGS